MADQVVSDALIWPRDEGLPGVSDDEETWHSAGLVAMLAQMSDSPSYVRSADELTFTGHDGTNDEVDVTAGVAYLSLSGETVDVQTALGGNSPPSYDTAMPTLPAVAVMVPTTVSGVALQDSTASDVWLAFDTDGTGPGSSGSVYVRSDDTGSVTAPSHPSVKLGSANPDDSGADVLENRGASPTFNESTHESVSTESADITERWDFETGYTVPAKRITDDDDYNHEPHIIRLSNNELLVVYQRSDSHDSSDSDRLVARKSTDFGESWGSEITVADPSGGAANNPNAYYVEDEETVVVQYREDGGGDNNTYQVTSTDNGETWSSPTQISAFTISPAIPFGQAVETSQGWMLLAYTSDTVEAVFSADGYSSWGSVVTVADTSSGSISATEPCALTVDDERIIVYGRDSSNGGGFFASKSSDGGQSWGSVEGFTLDAGNTHGTPLHIRPVDETTALAVWGRRRSTAGELIFATASTYALWQDPTMLADASHGVISDSAASDYADFGYPTTVSLGEGVDHQLCAWYDEDTDPNIWVSSIPDDTRNAGPYTMTFSLKERVVPNSDTTEIQFAGLESDAVYKLFYSTHIESSTLDLRINGDGDSTGNYVYYDTSGRQASQNSILLAETDSPTSVSGQVIIEQNERSTNDERVGTNNRYFGDLGGTVNFSREGTWDVFGEEFNSVDLSTGDSFPSNVTVVELWERNY